ncbi:hypothetical protein F4778DRAFT_59904 [Xylariomycetidae sp. FL2044]|nr:hypothetical protein F4778DRAFT_59904 [Xylariomycetidae sp. FL2044]
MHSVPHTHSFPLLLILSRHSSNPSAYPTQAAIIIQLGKLEAPDTIIPSSRPISRFIHPNTIMLKSFCGVYSVSVYLDTKYLNPPFYASVTLGVTFVGWPHLLLFFLFYLHPPPACRPLSIHTHIHTHPPVHPSLSIHLASQPASPFIHSFIWHRNTEKSTNPRIPITSRKHPTSFLFVTSLQIVIPSAFVAACSCTRPISTLV